MENVRTADLTCLAPVSHAPGTNVTCLFSAQFIIIRRIATAVIQSYLKEVIYIRMCIL
jgi:hypothetical protein